MNLSSNETHSVNKFDVILNIENVVVNYLIFNKKGSIYNDTIIGDLHDNVINPING